MKAILLLWLIPHALAQCNVDRARPMLQWSAYDFAVGLTARISQEQDYHFVASTLSPWALLAAISLGASGQTLAELQRVLRLHGQPCFNDRYFELANSVTSNSDTTLERSSTVFVDRNAQIKNSYLRRLRRAGVGGFEVLSFANPDEVAATINDYVTRATHDTIHDVIVPSDLEDVSVVMVDAIFFKGAWSVPFSHKWTQRKKFHNDRGVQLGSVNMMRMIGTFNCSSVELINATVLELPYGDSRYAMLVFLPDRGVALSTVIFSLQRVSLTTIYALFAAADMQMVEVQMPRFKITSDHNNLKELLSDMGIKSAFDTQLAEFPLISDLEFYISNFVQKANIEVNEEGSVAGAATAGFFVSRSSPDEFTANRPFFYMIIDKLNMLPVFTGAYSKPTEY